MTQFAKVGAVVPGLERALAPMLQTALTENRLQTTFPPGAENTGGGENKSIQGNASPGQPQEGAQEGAQEPFKGALTPQNQGLMPSPFNILTADDIQQEAVRRSKIFNDPNMIPQVTQQLNNLNTIATEQRRELENDARASGISTDEMPRFMMVGTKFDPRNPSQWLHNTKQAYKEVKSNDDKLERTFVPGLLTNLKPGSDRPTMLKRLNGVSKDYQKLGLEDWAREKYADMYLSPTEIEEQFRPITPEKKKAINSLPKGVFPLQTREERMKSEPNQFIPYEEAVLNAPKEMEGMQNNLANFFKNNVDDDTSLLVLRDQIAKEKNYDWRQFGPAIRQAMDEGLKLSKRQSTEIADIDTQPPIESLPEIFMDWNRVIQYLRGNK
jgi:hypothetical protein